MSEHLGYDEHDPDGRNGATRATTSAARTRPCASGRAWAVLMTNGLLWL
jgi:hypothetical protein